MKQRTTELIFGKYKITGKEPVKSGHNIVVVKYDIDLTISYPESATVVPRPTLICLELRLIGSGRRVGICLCPSVSSGL